MRTSPQCHLNPAAFGKAGNDGLVGLHVETGGGRVEGADIVLQDGIDLDQILIDHHQVIRTCRAVQNGPERDRRAAGEFRRENEGTEVETDLDIVVVAGNDRHVASAERAGFECSRAGPYRRDLMGGMKVRIGHNVCGVGFTGLRCARRLGRRGCERGGRASCKARQRALRGFGQVTAGVVHAVRVDRRGRLLSDRAGRTCGDGARCGTCCGRIRTTFAGLPFQAVGRARLTGSGRLGLGQRRQCGRFRMRIRFLGGAAVAALICLSGRCGALPEYPVDADPHSVHRKAVGLDGVAGRFGGLIEPSHPI